MSSLNHYFAEKVCINLARRRDRWVRAQEEFRLHGLTGMERFEAFDGASMRLPDGWDYGAGSYGCLRSHTTVVKAARDRGSPSILIVEDDVEFHPHLNSLFDRYAGQIPADWDALLFGGMHLAPPGPVSPNIVRLNQTSSTYAWALRSTLYDAFLEINRDTIIAVDENNHILQQRFAFYGFMPHLAWVRERDHSDVMEAETNPWWLRHSLVMHGPEQERALRSVGVIVLCDNSTATDILQCVLRLYSQVVEPNAIRVVERAEHPDTSPIDCYRQAAASLPGKQFFICAPYDLLPLRSELRATLLCCAQQYDLATPLYAPLPLNESDVRHILRDDYSAIDTGRYPRQPAPERNIDFRVDLCIVAAHLLHQPPESWWSTRVFRSPGRIVKLSHSFKAQASGSLM